LAQGALDGGCLEVPSGQAGLGVDTGASYEGDIGAQAQDGVEGDCADLDDRVFEQLAADEDHIDARMGEQQAASEVTFEVTSEVEDL
jgi:hypothetical protein